METKKYDAVVIGTVFTDIKGFAATKYNPFGRNLGKIDVFQGGVARNVAENMVNLGTSVTFVSAIDNSMLGEGVLNRLDALNIGTKYVNKVDNAGMGIWMLINNESGEQAGSISQMPDPANIEIQLSKYGDEIFSSVDNIVLEADVNEGTTRKTVEFSKKYGKKIYALPAQMDIVLQTKDILCDFECFIINNIEAGILFNADTKDLDHEQMLEILKSGIKQYGIPSMVVTMGEKGCVYADTRKELYGFAPALKVNVIDSSGAGDSFFSGCVSALIKGLPLNEAVVCGTKLAALTIQEPSCNCSSETVKNANIL